MKDYLASLFAGIFVLVIAGVIAILLFSCGDIPRQVSAPPRQDLAIALVASTYEAGGEPMDATAISVTWWDAMCLASFKVDTEHWELRQACVHGVALGCALQVIRPAGDDRPLARSSLAHEMYHCQGFQAAGGRIEGLDIEHRRPGWKTLVPMARQVLSESGL